MPEELEHVEVGRGRERGSSARGEVVDPSSLSALLAFDRILQWISASERRWISASERRRPEESYGFRGGRRDAMG